MTRDEALVLAISARLGVPVVVSDYVPSVTYRQTRFPKSRRRRIRKKWQCDRRNWSKVALPPQGYFIDGVIVVNPAGYELIAGASIGGFHG